MMRPFDQDKEEEGEEKEKEQESEEAAKVKMVRKGYSPTQKEIDEHMVTHLPCRAWCVHCVKGKCKGSHHRRWMKRLSVRSKSRLLVQTICSCRISKNRRKREACPYWW